MTQERIHQMLYYIVCGVIFLVGVYTLASFKPEEKMVIVVLCLVVGSLIVVSGIRSLTPADVAIGAVIIIIGMMILLWAMVQSKMIF